MNVLAAVARTRFIVAVQALCVAAVLLACGSSTNAATIPCDRIANNAASTVDIAEFDLDGSGLVAVSGCRWSNANVTVFMSHRATLSVRDVTMQGGRFVVAPEPSKCCIPEGSALTVTNSKATNCSDCFSVAASSVTGFSLVVSDSTLHATHSAASINSASATGCSITVVRSVMSVTATEASGCSAYSACIWAALGTTLTAVNFSVESAVVVSEGLCAACSVGSASSYSIVANFTSLRVSSSNVSARATSRIDCPVASVGIAVSLRSVTTQALTISATHSTITAVATSVQSYVVAASMGVVSSLGSLEANDTSIYALDCTVTSRSTSNRAGYVGAASVGFAGPNTLLRVSRVSLYALFSNVTAAALAGADCASAACLGFAASSRVAVESVLIYSSNSSVVCTASAPSGHYPAAASLGAASYVSITSLNTTIYAVSSEVVSSAYATQFSSAAASVGFATSNSFISGQNTTLYVQLCSVTSNSTALLGYAMASSVAFTSYSTLNVAGVLSTAVSLPLLIRQQPASRRQEVWVSRLPAVSP